MLYMTISEVWEMVVLTQVSDAGKVKRKKGMFGRQTIDKEVCAKWSFINFAMDDKLPYFVTMAVIC